MVEGFEQTTFSHGGRTLPVLHRGEGPGVLVIHEVPGVTPEVLAFARRVADEGFHVAAPVLFGTPGRPFSVPYVASSFARACVSREFHVLAAHRSSPVTDWLRALARALHEQQGGPGVGAIGMCLTGNFALALMMEPALLAPVLSQPSLPLPLGRARRAALHVSPEELANARERAAAGAGVLGLRFTHDPVCPPERFETLRRELGAGFEGIEIDSSPGNPHGIPRTAHSVVTNDLVDEAGHPTREALERVLALFRERLRPAAEETSGAAEAPRP
jgi:dienelactone hydrolase